MIGPQCCCIENCEPPKLECKRFEPGHDGYGTPGRLHYEISNASSASITITCVDESGFSTVTTNSITLSGGSATGDITTDPNCTYCVRAVNSCSTVTCCDVCDQIVCTLIITRHWIEGTSPPEYDYVEVSWTFATLLPGGATTSGLDGFDRIVSATLNGVDVFATSTQTPGQYVGSIQVNDPDSLPDSYELVVTNDCGRVKKCNVPVPCCWRNKKIRVTFSMSDVSHACTRTDIGIVNNVQYHSVTDEFSTSGLPSINGTHFIDCYWFTCIPKPIDRTIGSFTVRERGVLDQTDFRVVPALSEVIESIVEWTVVVTLTAFANLTESGGTVALRFSIQNNEYYNKRTVNGVVRYDGQKCVCGNLLNPYTPPCGSGCIGGGANQVTPFIAGTFSGSVVSNFDVICGTASSYGYSITHYHPMAGIIMFGGTGGACDPTFPTIIPGFGPQMPVLPVTTITLAAVTEYL